MIQCDICLKEFKYNYLLTRHNNNKKKCKPINDINYSSNSSNSSNTDDSDIDDNLENNLSDNLENNILSKKKYIKINKLEKEIKIIEDKISKNSEKSIRDMKCIFCKKDFNKKYNIERHVNGYCFYIKQLNEQKNKFNEEINNLRTQMELKELRRAVSKILKRKSQNINITNNKITNNKITNNNLMVNINSFGNESLSHITINDYKRLEKFYKNFSKREK